MTYNGIDEPPPRPDHSCFLATMLEGSNRRRSRQGDKAESMGCDVYTFTDTTAPVIARSM